MGIRISLRRYLSIKKYMLTYTFHWLRGRKNLSIYQLPPLSEKQHLVSGTCLRAQCGTKCFISTTGICVLPAVQSTCFKHTNRH